MIGALVRDFDSWRRRARELLADGIPPSEVEWTDGVQGSLFASATESSALRPDDAARPEPSRRVPAQFLERAELASFHSSPDRFGVLYRLLWKILHGAPHVLDDPLDPDTARLTAMLREVREAEHDMHAFVRFRRTVVATGEHWIAWYAPAHPVLPRVAQFFARRYPAMNWTLFTPQASANWDGRTLTFGPGAPRSSAPATDELDALFLTYYASIFNPARTNLPVMHRHLPTSVRVQIPEGAVMNELVRRAEPRVSAMKAPRPSTSVALLPEARDLTSLAKAACACRACPIGEKATQTVFGEGPHDAKLMIVGEQPGDEEDRRGRPFVGPAGRLLDELMDRARLPRSDVYLTNAVKHFKFEPRGKRRLHSKPNREEVDACHGWLLAEVDALKPEMILCLGATAAQSFCGPGFRVQRDRGKPQATPWSPWWMATYHPSALLRASDQEARAIMESAMLEDLTKAREQLAAIRARP